MACDDGGFSAGFLLARRAQSEIASYTDMEKPESKSARPSRDGSNQDSPPFPQRRLEFELKFGASPRVCCRQPVPDIR